MPTIADHHHTVRLRIEKACELAGRPASTVRLIAVSKLRSEGDTLQLHGLGLRDFAENRVQEGQAKIPSLPRDIVWHLIGRLQTNKAKYLPGLFDWVHSVDRAEIAEALEKAYAKSGQRVRALIQVNISGEEQKAGVDPGLAEDLIRIASALPHLDVQGLMTMAPYEAAPEATRPVFRGLRELRDRLRLSTGLALPHLSMGMTNDFEIAIQEGATMIRVGTALYEGTGQS